VDTVGLNGWFQVDASDKQSARLNTFDAVCSSLKGVSQNRTRCRPVFDLPPEETIMHTQSIPVSLGNHVIFVEATILGGEEQVSAETQVLDMIRPTIVELGHNFASILKEISPKAATVEFSVEIAIESGQLTALLVKGTTKGNLKITLSW
jgi:Trypsin-co-occurring domain 1